MSKALRDKNGRFSVGNPGGPGRPPIAKERQYADTLASVCCADDWQAVCRRAVKDAKRGDHRARDWLTKYLIGQPQQAVHHGHLHAEVSARHQDNPFEGASADAIIAALTAMDRLEEEAEAGLQRFLRNPRLLARSRSAFSQKSEF